MKVKDFIEKSRFTNLTGTSGLDREIRDVYVGDLLSRVMSSATAGSAWITIHTHMNILAVAALNDLPLIIIPEGINVPDPVVEKAVDRIKKGPVKRFCNGIFRCLPVYPLPLFSHDRDKLVCIHRSRCNAH
jgi:hypothetical protein